MPRAKRYFLPGLGAKARDRTVWGPDAESALREPQTGLEQ
jgi:hypothetical protein